MARHLRHELLNRRKQLQQSSQSTYKPIPTDAVFWRAWKADRTTMKKSGVVLRKVGSTWLAFLEVGRG